ncbi:MAG: amidohydrolase family protein [Planctomycetota bacterium]|nr:amidohydrolase family protein [Planctomycetota bacterium]
MNDPYDLVLENAMLIDGTGTPARKADVAVREDTIVCVDAQLPEPEKAAALKRVDLKGKMLAPGFVDVHAHGELEPLADTSAAGKIAEGVTTEISGNCGCTPFPLYGELRKRYEREARDDYGWDARSLSWTSVAQYFDRLEGAGCTLNRGFLLGHGCLRAAVNGYGDNHLGTDGKAKMLRETEAALEAGVFGLSTGLVYPPGCYAPIEEVIDLAKVCADRGALYTSHMRCEGDKLEEAINETLTIARKSGARTQISHLKTSQQRNWHKIAFLEKTLLPARQEGLDFHADRYPYVASSTGLDAVLPRWAYAGGNDEELKRLNDPATCAKLEEEVTQKNTSPDYWERILIAGVIDEALREKIAGRTVAEIARERGERPFEAMRQILIEDKLRTSAIFFSMSEENLEKILSWDFVMIASDATARNIKGPTKVAHPHPRTFGTFPRVIAKYVRERKLFSLEEAIRRMTSLPADVFHIRRRGRVTQGCYADLVVFDAERIRDTATFSEPNQFPKGIDRVYVNGKLVVEGGTILDARPGRVLRHAA